MACLMFYKVGAQLAFWLVDRGKIIKIQFDFNDHYDDDDDEDDEYIDCIVC